MKKTFVFTILALLFSFAIILAPDSKADNTMSDKAKSEMQPYYCLADLNHDHVVNNSDLLIFLGCFPCAYKLTVNCPQCVCSDFNGDGQINWWDMNYILNGIAAGTSGCSNTCGL